MQPNGGKLESAETFDWFMHFLTFGLKILFSSCPPPGLYRGWPAFFVSLVYIGFMAALVRLGRLSRFVNTSVTFSDFAKIFGCLVGLKDEVTAITIVTFGTSMIDAFATRKAAALDPTADNTLGNVIAANSISVFLGKYLAPTSGPGL